MTAICLLDTSIFVNILRVPFMSGDHDVVMGDLKFKIDDDESMFLPVATIIETGNHIGQNGDGNQRRQCAERFVEQVQLALIDKSPFTAINFLEAQQLQQWLNEFPDWVGQKRGLGDLSIMHDWQRQCELHRARRVYIWSLDADLGNFNRGPVV